MKKVIFITGVSSGFGLQIAKTLSSQGHVVYGTSRKDGYYLEGIKVVRMDVTSDIEVKATIDSIVKDQGRIDVLINNAGIGLGGALQDYTEAESMVELNTNLMGAFRCSKHSLPYMIAQGGGTIITIGSIAGLLALPFQGFYSASKFGVEGFMESLRYEVSRFGVKVVLVNPGDFHTGFTSNRRLVENAKKGNYKDALEKTLAVIENDETGGLDPAILAKKIGRIVSKKSPKHRYIIASLDQKLAVLLKRILPSKLFFKVLASHYKVG